MGAEEVFEVMKYKLWQCPKCGERMMAPVEVVEDDEAGIIDAEMEYKHKCEVDLKALDDSWVLFPNNEEPLLAFKVME